MWGTGKDTSKIWFLTVCFFFLKLFCCADIPSLLRYICLLRRTNHQCAVHLIWIYMFYYVVCLSLLGQVCREAGAESPPYDRPSGHCEVRLQRFLGWCFLKKGTCHILGIHMHTSLSVSLLRKYPCHELPFDHISIYINLIMLLLLLKYGTIRFTDW